MWIYHHLFIHSSVDRYSACFWFVIVIVQSPNCVWLFMTPWTATRQGSLSLSISQSVPKFMSTALVMPTSHLILWCALLLLLNFSSIRDCSNESTASGDQNIGASAASSVLSMSIQGWFPLRLASLISLLSRGLSGVFSRTTVGRHQFFGAQTSLPSSSHNCMLPLGRP